MTNYDCYFGNLRRAMDTLANLIQHPYDHSRKEVRELHTEIRKLVQLNGWRPSVPIKGGRVCH